MTTFIVFYLVPFLGVYSGALAFVSSRKHLLNTLLSLEYMMLMIFWLMSMAIVSLGSESVFVLFFLTLAACEGALGLGLLVSVVRSHGSDMLMSFSLLQC